MQVVRCGRFVFSFVVCGFVELSALFDKIHGERTEQRDISLVYFFFSPPYSHVTRFCMDIFSCLFASFVATT